MADDNVKQLAERDFSQAGDGYVLKCRHCERTPEHIGWCDRCGYNRDYEKIATATTN